MPLGIITLEDVLEGKFHLLQESACLNDVLELIGEEIYDEFDDEGARVGQYEAPPIQVRGEDGNPPRRESSAPPSLKPEPVNASQSQGKATGLKGLGFFRTKSAPPIPLDLKNPVSDDKPEVQTEEDITALTAIPVIQMPRPVKGIRSPPSIILEHQSNLSKDGVVTALVNPGTTIPSSLVRDTARPPARSNSEGFLAPPSTAASALPTRLATNVPSSQSRSGSPAPPLEAVLFERKRRLHAGGTGPSPSGTSPSTPTPQGVINTGLLSSAVASLSQSAPSAPASGGVGGSKGTKFKSSPLGGVERSGVVVAEQVGAAYSAKPRQQDMDVNAEKEG